ncbi:MAG: MerR family DNA-binding transcriptional regulator [Dorea longicatena]
MNEKTVGMLAKFTGVSVHTIKYYEKIGLLSSTRREHSNYRSYDIRACTDIYECMKYKNLGFALKEVGNLIKEADSEAIDNLLKKRLEEIDASLSELQELKKRVTDYLAETEEIEKKQGNWYIEEMPDFWIRFQTNNLEYGKNAQLESDGINFMDYAPESKSVLKISRESLNGTENQFSWGQAVRAEYIEDIEKNENVWSRQKGYTRIKGGRAFVLYLKITGPYASEGVLQKKIRKIYRKFQKQRCTSPDYFFYFFDTEDNFPHAYPLPIILLFYLHVVLFLTLNHTSFHLSQKYIYLSASATGYS